MNIDVQAGYILLIVSCVGWAVGWAVDYYQTRQQHRWPNNSKPLRVNKRW